MGVSRIFRETPRFLFLACPPLHRLHTHKPAIVALLHDIHTVPLTKFQLILVLGPVLVHSPVPVGDGSVAARGLGLLPTPAGSSTKSCHSRYPLPIA